MWRIRLLSLVVFGLMALSAVSQSYGSEWIDAEKAYYKIQVAEDGLYRVTATQLVNAGVPVGSIARSRYQLFHHGKEVAIRVHDDNGDGRLDSFEFYGERNDGQLDTELYVAPAAQPHDRYSLFSDTSSYFLTWHLSSLQGKRMAVSSIDDPQGNPPSTYHISESMRLQTGSYSSGRRYGSSYDIQSAVYDYGEGWTGANISKNSSQNFSFTLENYDNTAPKPRLEIILHGISNFSHVTNISVGSSTASLRDLGQATFAGRDSYRYSSELEWSDVGASGSLAVRVTSVGVSGQTDVVAVAYVKVDFPQSFQLNNSTKTFKIPDSDNNRQHVTVSKTVSEAFEVFDISDVNNVAVLGAVQDQASNTSLEFVYRDTTSTSRTFLATSEIKSVASVKLSAIGTINTAADYLIISHPALNELVDGARPIDQYVAYRQSEAGGNHAVALTYMDQLYDQFSYGLTSPLAIRNYLSYMRSQGSVEHVFLIGKGTTVNNDYHRKTSTSLIHYVPTYGYPGSDALFSLDNTSSPNYDLPIGRINAFAASDVKNYLDKVKEMEALGYDRLWRKNLLHLSGGQTPAELSAFSFYIQNFSSIAEGDFLGGSASNVNKNSTDDVKVINVADEVNDGVSMITFFGHSSGVVTDIEIGRASDPAAGYSNQGKYPTILVNGCNAGGIFGNTSPSNLTFGEDWIRTPNAGALAFIANSDFALSSNLKRYSDIFYQIGFATDETFGRSVGEIMRLVADRYFQFYGDDDLSQSQVYQTVLQGDPAIHVFGASKPDYELRINDSYVTGNNQERVVANVDSFKLQLAIRNYGRTLPDSIDVEVVRTFADGKQRTYQDQFARVLLQDTLTFSISNQSGDAVAGTNSFMIRIDPENTIPELNEGNNSGTLEVFIPKGNTIPLYPVPYSTVNGQSTTLVWQSANMLERDRLYSLQIDTLPDYSSSFASLQSVQGQFFNAYELDLSAIPDSTTFYWRTRFAEAVANEDTNWVASSFTVVANEPEGWAQIGNGQFSANGFSGVTYDENGKTVTFNTTTTPVQLNTHGANSTLQYEDYQVIVDGLNLLLTDNAADPTCKRRNAINAVVFDRQTAQPYRPFGISGTDVFNDLVCGRLPQMIHNFNENDVLGPNRYLDALIEEMNTRDMILLFSFGTVNYSSWDAQLIASLNELGIQSSTITSLQDGQPVIFLAKKGDAPGQAIEITSNGSTIPVQDQSLELMNTVTGQFSSGSINSTLIGPASNWDSFHYQVRSETNDDWLVNVHGVDRSGNRNQLFTGNRVATAPSELDLTGVDAGQYPFLQLDFLFSDLADQTPPVMDSWGVTYEQVPEGIISPVSYETKQLKEGQLFETSFLFANISEVEYSDSLDVTVAYTHVTSGDREVASFKAKAPAVGDTTVIELSRDTRGLVGDNSLTISVIPPGLENYLTNNTLVYTSAFAVEADEVNPVLDVTIDGSYILDGDIVSPQPNIRILLKDDNQYLFKEDTAGLIIEMRRACEECVFERVNLSDPAVTYTPSSEDQDFEINYAAGPLEDGEYTLRVQGADASGNPSGLDAYEVSFEVINESTITHFYPYPNPFATSTRFVFTLTGSTIPDQIKIQIMTVSGRVVREITQDEIGPLKIGNNITQYAWDGRDEYGDQLANGVYLYKVFIRQNGESMKHRVTNADRAFKNGFGKIYLLK
ncbi:C25 family cysteine peptidase [Marinoscillum sp.]|uniref:putative type IX secretion system sortase PorU2 n=1 Tax=Marinoscillum sp. TaxID=2024838 RepID=UPI003BACDF94